MEIENAFTHVLEDSADAILTKLKTPLLSHQRMTLSNAFSSGLPPEKPHNALSLEYDHPVAYLLLRRKDNTAVSLNRILGIGARIYVRNLHLNPVDEVTNRQLESITPLKAESRCPLSSLENFRSTRRSLERVSLIPWTVKPSISGLTSSWFFLASSGPSIWPRSLFPQRSITTALGQAGLGHSSFLASGLSFCFRLGPPPTPLSLWRL